MADFDDMPPLVDRPAFLFPAQDDMPPFSLFPHDDLPPLVDQPGTDDMPPLVDRPPPLTMMTYTFGHDLTPTAYATSPTRFEIIPEDDAPRVCAPTPDSVHGGVTRTSHAKKRDESYIPRPPNAFILFRSSFIKSQQIPGKIEGNHSTLSKIIGMVWKGLPPDQREHWEAQAVKALADHRARYPHWRFRPAANAMAKVKDGPPERRRKNKKKEKEEAEGAGGAKGGAKRGRARVQKDRCETIAGFVSKGMTGETLESAVKAWDEGTKAGQDVVAEDIKVVQERPFVEGPKRAQTQKKTVPGQEKRSKAETAAAQNASALKARSASPADDARFMTPLTSMFRRSSSVPVPPLPPLSTASPSHSTESQSPASPWSERRGSFSSTYDGASPVLGLATLTNAQYAFYASSPPGSPYSAVSSPTDLSAPGKDAFLSNSNYSSLYGWAGEPAPPAVYGAGDALLAAQASQGLWAYDELAMLPAFA
ncbi:hypothetical protein OF83DRAFT_1171985 [Amylostereum chailletii]|nr:hypothetical protein OF83DRAFT_1171985 [Amylostereum chailletii]